MKTLIAYYSRGGTTRKAAYKLQKQTDGDMFEITGEKDYGGYFMALGTCVKDRRKKAVSYQF